MAREAKELPRRLAVILHADVVDSTALVQRDERLAHQRIADVFERLVETSAKYSGVAHEVRGDALVAEFERASDAVCAALTFQASNAAHNENLSDAIRPDVRIGIGMGEVVIADGTVTGAGVVLAQRLEQLAETGGVVIQGAAHETLPRWLPFDYAFLGEREVKGFDDPVRAFAVSLRPGEPVPAPDAPTPSRPAGSRRRWAAPAAFLMVVAIASALAWWRPWHLPSESVPPSPAAGTREQKPSLVVLPFENFSGDEEQEYFADGMTEDLITDLSKVDGLFVIARSSSFVFKGKGVDARRAAQELNVRYVLEGSVRRGGDRVRINAQLIDAATGGHVWAERYDRSLTDIFKLQNEVIERIVAALAIKLTPQTSELMTHRSTENVTAYDHFLRGQALARTTSFEQAREAYEQAFAVDPEFARAYGALSITYTFDVQYGWSMDPRSDKDRALALATKAVTIDANLPQAHFALSLAYFINGSHEKAEEAARRAVALDPGYADALALLGWIYGHDGQPDKTLAIIEETRPLNPFMNAGTLGILGLAHLLKGHFEEAVEIYRSAVDKNPELMSNRLYLAITLSRSGRQDEAEWEAAEILALNPDFSVERWVSNQPHRDPAERDRIREDLLRTGLPE